MHLLAGPAEVFMVIASRGECRVGLRLGHYNFLPSPYQFVTHFIQQYLLSLLAASLNNHPRTYIWMKGYVWVYRAPRGLRSLVEYSDSTVNKMLGSALRDGEVCRGSDVCSDRNLVKSVIAFGARWTKQRSRMQRRSDAEVNMKLGCFKMQ